MADLKKIKKAAIGLFWQEDETKPQDITPQPAINLEPLTTEPIPFVNTTSAPAAVDQEFYSAIEKELAKATPPEFSEFYNQMSVINEKFSNLDKSTRYQLAFHAAQTALKARNQNLSSGSLSKSISKMIESLDMEKREFHVQNEQGFQTNLSKVRNKAEEISQNVQARENRLQALQQEIDAFLKAKNDEKKRLDEERAQLISQRVIAEGEMNQLQQKKAQRETNFDNALEAHRQRLEQLKTELDEHLKSIK